ncbi:MAG: hypothetical protein C0490_18180 [Marivirga sp.]|nr:hypothetical protein [Marivirga sp.]
MDARKRIIEALDKSGKTRQALADQLGLGRGAVSDMLNKEGELDSIKYLEATADLTGYSFEWLRTGKGPEKESEHFNGVSQQTSQYLKGKVIRPVTVVVNQSGRELMSYVPVRAQAGYMKGYGDPHFLEKLPAFSLPILKEGAYRMFEVDGDSMLQIGGGGLHDGDIVVAHYVEDIFSVRDNRVYVVISTEGVCVKRCLNRLKDKENPVLILNSDNKNGQHAAIILRAHEILEVWELKAFISKQLSFSTDLWEILNDLQVQHALLKDKVQHLETKNLMP